MSSRFLDRNCRDHVGFHFQVSNFFLKPPIDTMAHLYTVELTIMKGLHVVIPRCQRDTWEVLTVGCRLTPAHQQCLITHWILRKGRHRQWAFDYTMAMTLSIVILENSPYYCTALRESPQAQTSYICQAIKSVLFYFISHRLPSVLVHIYPQSRTNWNTTILFNVYFYTGVRSLLWIKGVRWS